ncbi:ABC transporter ATP-binding protein [Clostridium saccharobutylicum]|uniref:ABC transporter ATP-binding protein n=1 Tax=Clostridium saccharobutylicum TaxID=169679 RepID=UPI00041215B6|nr:ABC transporter ATP-binding protein [Clostridium saccharobutylicum]AQR91601.1 lipoprotein-releasing system ATP-binding protein LolD [Clostridium saccharobutylicum]AQS01506.1 lipoprotein-releasing system ATP-binding protein LolD [Clostridium saccharobutylicum]AQS11113.1 lipoprotein-releasing system ATP-binding protein LolD [Clostridium saccharobutylicum]AQS15489.1 lipoprotein-releasing system ATP-binding protein LolD [Clostridium saccharobutylicum]MBA2906979.1 putative ABC transport system A
MNNNVIEMTNITKSFYIGKPNQLNILKNININIKKGEFVSIVGESGSGKSTLMNIIGALDRQTSGQYILDGIDIRTISDKDLSIIRNRKIGFVFQSSNLIPRTNSIQNVELPMLYADVDKRTRRNRAKELLQLVGIDDRMFHLPNELSGGQKQRVAIARALANDPEIILADEPTGALDSNTGRLVMNLFHKIHENQGKTIVLITHNKELSNETQRIIQIKDGQIVEEKINTSNNVHVLN